ncbi:flagellar biosynthesis regulator FlaF [Alsobacter sp. R-9]
MNAAHHAAGAYARTSRTGLSGRKLEAAVLTQCAADLRKLAEDPSPALPAIVDVLDRNRRVWSIFTTAAMQDDSGLPITDKEALLSLSTYVFERTYELLGSWDAAKALGLAEINRRLAGTGHVAAGADHGGLPSSRTASARFASTHTT